MTSDPALELRGVAKTYVQADKPLAVLVDVHLTVPAGKAVALMAPSGAGKTTLLQIAGLLDTPDTGEVCISGQSAAGLGDPGLSAMRRQLIGFVFQFHHLLPDFTAVENVVLAQMIAGLRGSEARLRALELLDMMGLDARAEHRPAQLSGGEQQRVAIARALANAPRLLLADEPTGNLDQETGMRVARQLLRIVHGTGVGALVATHNPEVAALMDRTVRLDGGRLVDV